MTAERRMQSANMESNSSSTPVSRTHLVDSSETESHALFTRQEQVPSSFSPSEPNHENDQPLISRNRRRIVRVLRLMASPLADERGSPKSVCTGLLVLFIVGAGIGLATPKNHALPTPWYQSVSACIGYIYFLAWSTSFYPQVVINMTRRSTEGLSPDFCVLNVLGFACYTAYNVSFFWSRTIQELYRKRHGADAEITVQSNDVAFAIHALILSSATVLQILYFGGGVRALALSKPILLVIAGIIVVCTLYPILIWVTASAAIYKNEDENNNKDLNYFNWLDFLYLLSFVKIGISLVKYIPQVILNVQRKSTVGWSIQNIILDFSGGVLSDLQLVFDCMDLNDFSGITGNPAKFALGFVSIIFDIIFMIQHYCLYPSNNGELHNNRGQQEPLLSHEEIISSQSEEEEEEVYEPETIRV